MSLDTPFVSVIIPTYRDWGRLAVCLKALADQTYPADAFEVIVVNNDPKNRVPDNYTLQPNVQVLTEAKTGSYAARNLGLSIAKGEVIGFTDSDCIPAVNWIEAAVSYFKANPTFDRIGGKVELFIAGKKHTLAEAYEVVYAFRQEDNVSRSTSVTANMFTKRKVFDAVGPFNADMFSGGDFEWGMRAGAKNYRIGFSADVVVKHPARRELKQLINKIKRVAEGKANEGTRSQQPVKRFLEFLYEARPPVNELKQIYARGSALSFAQKMQVFILRYRIRVQRAYEEMKIYNGAKPFRDIVTS
ncbi:glycosyltransferase [Pontibacter arcticus]|uniref:Glycosyltransferase 2-like domain-containing protein n=1 Tax=Pontibacter arcticus TaxID=2080288 RepID=A0A364RDU5_9BACT|nr:glycosyltransferase [Pontibacter arcticus]RAU82415.1 hypothetical protein DP923_11565 [Pontibacter arcticus]